MGISENLLVQRTPTCKPTQPSTIVDVIGKEGDSIGIRSHLDCPQVNLATVRLRCLSHCFEPKLAKT